MAQLFYILPMHLDLTIKTSTAIVSKAIGFISGEKKNKK